MWMNSWSASASKNVLKLSFPLQFCVVPWRLKNGDCQLLIYITLLQTTFYLLKCGIFFRILFYSPIFAKLEEWLENLHMHMEMRLPLMSEVDKIRQAFWENHSQPKQTYGIPSKQMDNSALGRS